MAKKKHSPQKKESLDVVVAGHLCLDFFPTFGHKAPALGHYFRPGKLVDMSKMEIGTGGAVSNAGTAMKIFGMKVAFMSRVGDDTIGRMTIDLLRKNGNADGVKLARGEHSSYSVVLSPEGFDRIFLHSQGPNDTFSQKDMDFAELRRARLLHLGYPTLMKSLFAKGKKELTDIMRKAKAAGTTTSLDISLPDPQSAAGKTDWKKIFRSALPHVDLFVPSLEESFFCLDPKAFLKRKEKHSGRELLDHVTPQEVEGMADTYLGYGCAVAVIKCGYNGWFVKTAKAERLEKLGRGAPRPLANWAGRALWCPAFQVDKIASATGSGDTSIAAFLTALLRGFGIEGALKMANCAGYFNLRGMDAVSGLAGWAVMEKTWPRLPVRDNGFLAKAGWKFQGDLKIWEKK